METPARTTGSHIKLTLLLIVSISNGGIQIIEEERLSE